MTGRERIGNILQRKSVDRIGIYENFWSDTQRDWGKNGWIQADENLVDRFDFDMDLCDAFNLTADLDFKPVVMEETDDTILKLDGNGAMLRWRKQHDSTPEHVAFQVMDRQAWDDLIKPKLLPDYRRIDFVHYRQNNQYCRERQRFFFLSGINVFECMHPVCGHEHLLYGMAMDPDWVKDMVATYARLIVELQEILFSVEGKPDGIFYNEDLGFSGRPFISPAMYDEIIKPGHQMTIAFAKSLRLPVMMHSCGMVEKLLPGMIDAGIDCLQALEVKAGMNLTKLYHQYSDCLSFCGGMDIRELSSNDLSRVDGELESKIPLVKQKYGYILQSDSAIPPPVSLNTYQHFRDFGLELGRY